MIIYRKGGMDLKKVIIFILCLCLLVSFPACNDKTAYDYDETQGQKVSFVGAIWVPGEKDIYSELFNYNSKTDFSVSGGTVLAFDNQMNHWYHINYNGKEGWIWVEDPDFLCTSRTVREVRVTAPDGIEVYDNPHNDAAVISRIEQGSVVSVIVNLHHDWVDGWSYTKVNGVYGWVRTTNNKCVEYIEGSEKDFLDIFGKTVVETVE